jgi:hypothetical protein
MRELSMLLFEVKLSNKYGSDNREVSRFAKRASGKLARRASQAHIALGVNDCD